MGGGGSSSKTTVLNKLSMNPVTDVDVNVDLDELAKVLQEGNENTLNIEKIKSKIALAGLQIEDEKNQIEALNNETNKKYLKYGAFVIGGYFIYKNYKKGKK